ncbi:MAG: cyclic nucleotide-binding domain-containing protein [Bryobacterales bacterium]|nr:cyclic nucleotide-binding domain-containing protein [Bryobacterales bacterium]
MSDLVKFLATVPVFRDVPTGELEEISALFREEIFPAGKTILRQGAKSHSIYFLRSGRLAIRVQKGEKRETVAFLQPPALFGELSYITGRAVSANVEVSVDASVVVLSGDAMAQLGSHRDAVMRGILTAVAERLHDTVTKGTKAVEAPVVLLRPDRNWEAPHAFAVELGRALSRQNGQDTLVAHVGSEDAPATQIGGRLYVAAVAVASVDGGLRADVAKRLVESKAQYPNIVLNPVGPHAADIADLIQPFADFHGFLLGDGGEPPASLPETAFVVASPTNSKLKALKGNQQLIWDAAGSEDAHLGGRPALPKFVRVAESMARFICGAQVGLALGGGAAWGWAHIGVLSVLEGAGIPIDVVSGCSMGTVIGSLRCSGLDLGEVREVADYWSTRTKKFLNWRIWQFCLISEKVARRVFGQYWGTRNVNQMEIPFWANAVDIKTGKEFTIVDNPIVDCVRASIALPGLLPPFQRDDHLLVDAGIMDPVPAGLVRRMGARYAISVNAMARLESQKMSTRYPMNLFDVMNRCMTVMGHEVGQGRAEELSDVVLTPALGDLAMLSFARAKEIIECGRKVAEENLPAIVAGYERLKGPAKTPQAAEAKN